MKQLQLDEMSSWNLEYQNQNDSSLLKLTVDYWSLSVL